MWLPNEGSTETFETLGGNGTHPLSTASTHTQANNLHLLLKDWVVFTYGVCSSPTASVPHITRGFVSFYKYTSLLLQFIWKLCFID